MNMASSSSPAMHFSTQTRHFSSQTKAELKASKTSDWTEEEFSRTSSVWSVEGNFHHYDLLKKDPEWDRFFRDFHTLELGEQISEGAQAIVYEARPRSHGLFNLVAKVMKGDAPLQAFQRQWPIGMLSAYKSEASYVYDRPLISILGGTVLKDERVKGRFAFIMCRRWGDLRRLIDRRMENNRGRVGPFFMDQVIELMSRIAEDMEGLHTKHIIHRDLKASNVLVWGKFGDNVHVVDPSDDEMIESVVADFECSVGVLGTGIWRAPEIIKQARAGVPGSEILFTRASDVYSYGMTCYEIVSGHFPFEGLSTFEVFDGKRPILPVELPSYLRSIIESCWRSDPEMRPNFSDICKMLSNKQGCNPANVRITSETKWTEIEVEQWGNLQPSTLIRAFERLLPMELWVQQSKMTDRRSDTGMIVQHFQVTDGEGSKIRDENIIAEIVKELSMPVKIEWIVEKSEDAGFTAEGSDDADTTSESYPLYIMSETSEESLPRRISAILSEMNFEVYDVRCCRNRRDLVECAFFAKGGQMDSLLREILAKEAGVEFRKIVLRNLPPRSAFMNSVGGTYFGQLHSLELPENYVRITSKRGGPSLLGRISAIMTETKIQVHEVRIRSNNRYVHWTVSVDARSMDVLLRQLLAKEAGSETPLNCEIVLWNFAPREVGLLLRSGKSSDLRAPGTRIHVGIDDSGFLPVRVICPQRPEFLLEVACSFSDSSILIKRYGVPSYGGIKVPRICMAENTYFQKNEDGERRAGFEDFGWNINEYYILHDDIEKEKKLKEYVDRYHIDKGELELICKVGFGELMQRIHENGLYFLSIDLAGLDWTSD